MFAAIKSILKQLVGCSIQYFHVQLARTMLLCLQRQNLPRVWSTLVTLTQSLWVVVFISSVRQGAMNMDETVSLTTWLIMGSWD